VYRNTPKIYSTPEYEIVVIEKRKNLTSNNDKNCKNIFKKKLKPITLYT